MQIDMQRLTAALSALPAGASEAELLQAAVAARRELPGELAAVFDAGVGRLLAEVGVRNRLIDRHRDLLLRLTELRDELDNSRERQAVMGERNRIAQDLHDRAAQTNFLVVLKLDWLLAHLPTDSPLRPELERLKELSAQAAAQTREAIYALRAPELAAGGVVGGIRSLLRELNVNGMEGSLTVSGVLESVPPAVEDALFKVAQEAINNARKHSQGSAVMVTLRHTPSTVTLVVQDDGVGLPPDAAAGLPGHFGLPGMRERLAAVGGDVQFIGGDDGGLIVRAMIPLAPDRAVAKRAD